MPTAPFTDSPESAHNPAHSSIVPAAATVPLDYLGPENVEEVSSDRISDLFVPAGLLALGFLALLAWIFHHAGTWESRETFVFRASLAMVTIKVAIVFLAAWYLARKSNGSLGSWLTTILKIAAIIVFLDSASLWLKVLMTETGAISPSGKARGGAILVEILVLACAALFVSRFIYRMDDDNAKAFGCLVAAGNWIANLVLLLTMTAAVHWLIAAHPRTASSLPANAMPSLAGAPAIVTTSADREIVRRISQGVPFVYEGRQWAHTFFLNGKDKPTVALTEKMYAAGAVKVYIDLVTDRTTGTPVEGHAKMYVELSANSVQRSSCADVAQAYCREGGATPVLSSAPEGRYMQIDLR